MECSLCDKKYYAKGLCKYHYQKKCRLSHKSTQKQILANRQRVKKWTNNHTSKQKLHYKSYHKKYMKVYLKEHPEIWLKSNKKQLEKNGAVFDMKDYEYMWAINSWSKSVKKRDNNTCQDCGDTENLEAHHIKSKKIILN